MPSTPCSTTSVGKLTTCAPPATPNHVRDRVVSSRAHGTPLRGTSHRKYSTPSVNRTPGASTINMGNDWMTAYRNSHCPDRISHMSSIFEPVACLNSNWRKASKNGVCCSASALCDCFSSFATSSLCSFFPRAFASFFASPVFAFCEMGYSGRSKGIGGATGGVGSSDRCW